MKTANATAALAVAAKSADEFSFIDDAGYVNQELIDISRTSYPGIIFRPGDTKMVNQKMPGVEANGGWFISAQSAGDLDLLSRGWIADTFTNGDGNSVEGFSKAAIQINIVASRRRWELGNGESFPWHLSKQAKAAVEAANQNIKDPSKLIRMNGHAQIIVFMNDLIDIPFCITLRGHSQMAFFSDGDYRQVGVLGTFDQKVIMAANEAAKQRAKAANRAPTRFDRYAFWLTVGGSRDEKGKPKFYTAGEGSKSRQIVIPVPMGLGGSVTTEMVSGWYVGREHLLRSGELKEQLQAEGWLDAWKTSDGLAAEAAKKEEAIVAESAANASAGQPDAAIAETEL